MKISCELTKKEFMALQDLLYSSRPCESACVWDECAKKAAKIKDPDEQFNYCDVCDFTQVKISLFNKLLKENG